MTLMLASVTGPQEAEVALAHGADIIDLKDTSKGAFGAVPPETVRATVAAVKGRQPVSAVSGEVPMEPNALLAAASAMADAGADYVKVGLFPGARRPDCVRALSAVARRTKLVGVLFADADADQALIPVMAESGFAAVMLDTARKGSGGLLAHKSIPELGDFIDTARAKGLLAGLAGSLEAPDVPRLLLLAPDILGFRGALCADGDRTGSLDTAAIDEIRGLIPIDVRRMTRDKSAPAKIDYRLLAARGYSVDPHRDDNTDRVFVHDFVLPVRIGTYARERDKPQNVRLNVDVKVRHASHAPEDMRDVFSYDVITDSIRMIVAQEHIALVEMLAERIAAVVLTHPRVASATVRVEKLDVGPGAVGVEIVRERPAEAAKVHHLFPVAAAESDPKAT
ncbi:MAG: (5-formylfuran-3-yl)methyl phosphate synthase [Alphaproteobacteria bacterium]